MANRVKTVGKHPQSQFTPAIAKLQNALAQVRQLEHGEQLNVHEDVGIRIQDCDLLALAVNEAIHDLHPTDEKYNFVRLSELCARMICATQLLGVK